MSKVLQPVFKGLGLSPDVKGPSNEETALQRQQREELDRKKKEEEDSRKSRAKIIAAAQGRRGLGTLFRRTGEAGVSPKKLGEGG